MSIGSRGIILRDTLHPLPNNIVMCVPRYTLHAHTHDNERNRNSCRTYSFVLLLSLLLLLWLNFAVGTSELYSHGAKKPQHKKGKQTVTKIRSSGLVLLGIIIICVLIICFQCGEYIQWEKKRVIALMYTYKVRVKVSPISFHSICHIIESSISTLKVHNGFIIPYRILHKSL